MLSLLARRPKIVKPCIPFHILLCNSSNFALKEPRKRTDHQKLKQQIIEKKKADVEAFIKQGIVKKAADLIKSVQNEEDVKYVRERDDPFYNTPSSSSDGGEEREYILIDEGKRKKKRKTEPGEKAEWEEEVETIAKNKKESQNREFVNCYPNWCAYYQPIFEQSPYSLGYQEPGENGLYSWSHALESANQMVFGNAAFRPLQLEALNASLRGEDVFLSLPTGGGKSLCFWLRALLSPGVVIVVSPLVALMHDQLQKLSSRGIPVLKLDSSTKAQAMKALRKEDLPYKLIYLTPERMRSTEFLDIFRNLYMKDLISMVAIDEAHCISEWGHDFRPSYRRLGIFREEFPNIPIMAMTATATPQVQKDILKNLHIEDTATVFEASFNRPNIYYEVRPKVMVVDDIAHFISSEKYSKASGLIYCLTKNDAQELADELRGRNIHASPYHSSMPAATRAQIQDAWKDGSIKVLCTTTAFGLGVDKADLRYVIHHTVPLSLEAYYQQTGRAGRDGLDSTCILYYAQSDFIRATKMLAAVNSNNPNAPTMEDSELLFESGGHMGVKVDLMDNVITYCSEEKKCRREILLAYFGEKIHRSACNHKCDNCQRVLAGKVKYQANKNHLLSLPQSDFLPPPHISLLADHSPHQLTHAERQLEQDEDGKVSSKQTEKEEEEYEEEEEEEEEKEILSPLERLRRRRLARKEMRASKLLHPGKGRTPAFLYDKVSKIRSKRARDRMSLYKNLKSEHEKRAEKLRDAHFSPEDRSTDQEVYGTSDPARFTNKPAKVNKTGKVAETSDNVSPTPGRSFTNSLRNAPKEKLNKTGKVTETSGSPSANSVRNFANSLRNAQREKLNKTGKVLETSDSTSSSARNFANSLRNVPKEKVNKTGKILQNDVAEDDESARNKPKQILSVLRKYNSLQFKSAKLNKTGKIDTSEQTEENKPIPPRFGNSLRNPTKEKLNKTGKIVAQDDEEITYTYRKLPPKLNKTGKISPDDEDVTRTAFTRTQKITKPNKTGRVEKPTSPRTPSHPNPATLPSSTPSQKESTSSQIETTPQDKKKPGLREYLAKLQAESIANSSAVSGPGGASAALQGPTKAAVSSFSSLKQVYNEIARENKKPAKELGDFLTEGVMLKIWSTKPTSILELTSIPGVGNKNATKYADKILPLFRK